MFRLDEDRVVDATLSGGLARYINHSCNPNCVTEIVEVDRECRIIIFAKRRINRGEEVSSHMLTQFRKKSLTFICVLALLRLQIRYRRRITQNRLQLHAAALQKVDELSLSRRKTLGNLFLYHKLQASMYINKRTNLITERK